MKVVNVSELTAEDRAYFGALRRDEYSRLDVEGDAYLDYTGSGLHPESLVRRHLDALNCGVIGNPHSENPSSRASSDALEAARKAVLDLFDVDDATHVVIFTANASGALRLVGEAFPFDSNSRFVLSADNHNSVNGIRAFAEQAGAQVHTLGLDSELRPRELSEVAACAPGENSLLAFPAQSNFSGVRHPLGRVAEARAKGFRVLLDAAAYMPTSPLSLREVPADFACLSFYKMFGYPTGVGALVARRDALELLKRPWFSGGTVAFVSSRHAVHRMKDGAEAFEDGTPHFQAMLAVADGVHSFRKIGAARIGRWTRHLTERALTRMNRMRRKDGGEAVEFYGPRNAVDRGATIPFNLLVDGGTAMSYDDVVAAASARRIHLRGGCFCNPGASEIALRFPVKESLRCMETMAHGPFSPQLFSECMGGHAVGAIRASFGLATTEADVDRFCDLLEELVAG